jgi:hypothetical protein
VVFLIERGKTLVIVQLTTDKYIDRLSILISVDTMFDTGGSISRGHRPFSLLADRNSDATKFSRHCSPCLLNRLRALGSTAGTSLSFLPIITGV